MIKAKRNGKIYNAKTIKELASQLGCELKSPGIHRFLEWAARNNVDVIDYESYLGRPTSTGNGGDPIEGRPNGEPKPPTESEINDLLKELEKMPGDSDSPFPSPLKQMIEDAIKNQGDGADADKIAKEIAESLSDLMSGQVYKHLKNKLDKVSKEMAVQSQAFNEKMQQQQKELEDLSAEKPKELEIKIDEKTKAIIKDSHKQFELLLMHVSTKEPVMMVGPAGSGKTTAAGECAKALDIAFYPQSIGAQTTKSDLLGFVDGHGEYRKTIFMDCYENGGIFLLDEVDAGNANTLTILNAALSNGYMSFPDKIVEKHKDFYCVAAANTFGQGADRQYVGRNQIDSATLDRFNTIYWDVDEELELRICSNKEWVKEVQGIRKRVEKLSLRHIVSPRASIKGEKLLERGMPKEEVLKSVVFKNLSEKEVKQIKDGVTAKAK